jgi:hypothetical protein
MHQALTWASTSPELPEVVAVGPRAVATVEPDGGNLHVRIWGGPGWVTGWGYPTVHVQRLRAHPTP